MTNEQIIDELAKALLVARQSRGFSGEAGWEYEPPAIHELYRASARAVIAKLAEIGPSKEAIRAGSTQKLEIEGFTRGLSTAFYVKDPQVIFAAMLRSLVSDKLMDGGK